jgi:hypothetical protein
VGQTANAPAGRRGQRQTADTTATRYACSSCLAQRPEGNPALLVYLPSLHLALHSHSTLVFSILVPTLAPSRRDLRAAARLEHVLVRSVSCLSSLDTASSSQATHSCTLGAVINNRSIVNPCSILLPYSFSSFLTSSFLSSYFFEILLGLCNNHALCG